MQLKEKKTIIKQYIKGVESPKDKSTQLSTLKEEIIMLKTRIEATEKVFDKLSIEKSNQIKVLKKEISSQRKKTITELKKEIKLLEQVYDYKMRGKI